MAGKKQHSGKLAAKYVAENPTLPNRTIARMLKHDHPKDFNSIDTARKAVGYVRGNMGTRNRKNAKAGGHSHLFRPNGKAGEITIPKGRTTFRGPLQIGGPLKVLVLSDSHVPYHDETVLEAAIRHGVDEQCEGVYLNGDLIDCYALSRWEKESNERDFKREVELTREILGIFAQHFERRWYKAGNHEERYDCYLQQRAEDLIEFTEFELKSLLRLDEQGYTFIHGKQWSELGKMPILHGHEFTRGLSAPVNPARGFWNRTSSTGMVGHLHRSSTHTEVMSLGGKMVAAWSLGCTCNLRPDYAVVNKWNHGWAIVTIDASGDFNVENYMFVDGKPYRA